jgi:multiple sugar transport system substrate-binding protein
MRNLVWATIGAMALAGGCTSSNGNGMPGVGGTSGTGGTSGASGTGMMAGMGGASGTGMMAGMGGAGGMGGTMVTPPDNTPVTISFWRHDNLSYRQADDDAFAAYTAAHPNVTITSATNPWATYTMALDAELKRNQFTYDLVLMPPAVVCGYADNLADVPADVVSLSDAQNTFFSPPLEGATCGGKLKGLPVEYNLEYGGVVVNMDKYHAKFPGKTPGWATWADFIADAKALAEFDPVTKKPCVNGLDIDPDWPEPTRHILLSQILQRGGKYWADDNKALFNFDTQQARDSLTEMVKWATVDGVLSPSLMPDKNTFFSVRLVRGAVGYGCSTDGSQPLSAMAYAGTWAVKDALSNVLPGTTVHLEYYPLPPMFGTEHKFVQNAGFAFAVPKTSKNQKVAWDIVKSIALSPETMRKWTATASTLPALRVNGTPEALASDPLLTRVQPVLASSGGIWMGYIPAAATAPVLGAMVSNYYAAIKGEKTIEKALQDMQDAANAAIMANQ